jgi:hypothetical protein
MQIAVGVVFVALIISAPWIARKWGNRGALVWGVLVLAFIIWVLLALE